MSALLAVPKREPDPAHEDRTRRVFLVIRRALLMVAVAIAKEYGTDDDGERRQ